jgi:hypothetical protein
VIIGLIKFSEIDDSNAEETWIYAHKIAIDNDKGRMRLYDNLHQRSVYKIVELNQYDTIEIKS